MCLFAVYFCAKTYTNNKIFFQTYEVINFANTSHIQWFALIISNMILLPSGHIKTCVFQSLLEVLPRHPGQICPLASVHHGLLIIPIHWLASSLCLLSTCSWCVVGVLAQYGCRRIIQVDAAHWWWLRRPPLLCKALWVPRKALYKCNKLLLLLLLLLMLMIFAIQVLCIVRGWKQLLYN